MTKPDTGNLSRREMRSQMRSAKKRRDRAWKFVRKCKIKLIGGLPSTLPEFMAFWQSHDNNHGKGILTFSRHSMTDYDDICVSFNARFGTGIADEMKRELHAKAWRTVRAYLAEIGFFETNNYNYGQANTDTIKDHVARRERDRSVAKVSSQPIPMAKRIL